MHNLALYKAIRYFGSQEALAKAIHATRRKIVYWLNEKAEIPYKYVLEIERATQNVVTRYELAPKEFSLNRYLDQRLGKSMSITEDQQAQCKHCKNNF